MKEETVTPNVPLLRKVVEWVEEQAQRTEDREWYQGDWITPTSQAEISEGFCKTAFCVAGKLVLDAGWEPIRLTGGWFSSHVRRGNVERDIAAVALKLLDLPPNATVHPLFHSDNTAADIRRIAEDIAGERL